MSDTQPNGVTGATDTVAFIEDLDGGVFARTLGVALSTVAASCIDTGRKGKVQVTFELEPITGTYQVAIAHTLKFTRPTSAGTASEEQTRVTVMHVGKGGALGLAQPPLPGMQQTTIKA